jgi:hypothetical protein
MKTKFLRGTAGTVRDEAGQATALPLRVLRTYLQWGDTPKFWGDARAMELAVAIRWALDNIDCAIEAAQEEIEQKIRTK